MRINNSIRRSNGLWVHTLHTDKEALLVLPLVVVNEQERLLLRTNALRGSEPQSQEACPTSSHLQENNTTAHEEKRYTYVIHQADHNERRTWKRDTDSLHRVCLGRGFHHRIYRVRQQYGRKNYPLSPGN